MLPEPELRRALAGIPPVPLHGPFNRFVSFDAMVSGQSSSIVGPRIDPQGRRVFEAQIGPLSWVELELAKRSLLPSQSLGNPLPLWGIGSLRNGGRYNKPSAFEMIYLAEDPITALAEVNLVFRPNADLGKIKGPPMVHIAVDGILENVLDVTLAEVQNTLATSHQELTGAWLWEQSRAGEAPTQRLGRIAFEKKKLGRIALSIFQKSRRGVRRGFSRPPRGRVLSRSVRPPRQSRAADTADRRDHPALMPIRSSVSANHCRAMPNPCRSM
jgi:hypothetical protein